MAQIINALAGIGACFLIVIGILAVIAYESATQDPADRR